MEEKGRKNSTTKDVDFVDHLTNLMKKIFKKHHLHKIVFIISVLMGQMTKIYEQVSDVRVWSGFRSLWEFSVYNHQTKIKSSP